MKKVLLIGPFPPPVHGMSKNLLAMKEDLENRGCAVYVLNTSPKLLKRNLSYLVYKVLNFLKNLSVMLFWLVTRRLDCVYMPPDAGVGGYLTLFYVILGKIFSIRFVYHHRSFNYIRTPRIFMSIINFISTKADYHVFLCQDMAEIFSSTYGYRGQCRIISNAMHVAENPFPPVVSKIASRNVRLSHLSNLSFEKGLKEIFSLSEKLHRNGFSVSLFVAGPFENDEVRDFFYKKTNESDYNVVYSGPVYGEAKDRFYSESDFFLFPSAYKNEAQPNVVFEALAHGVPVITSKIACLESDVSCECGKAINISEFTEQAFSYISSLCDYPDDYDILRKSAWSYVNEKRVQSLSDYESWINEL